MKPLTPRAQRTLRRPAQVSGRGFVTGARVTLRFQPAPEHSGLRFQRIDLAGRPVICAQADAVTGTTRRTTLGRPPHSVTLCEHVLAALAALKIDNCLVELDGPEPPGLDGSSREFAQALAEAGVETQQAPRLRFAAPGPLTVRVPGASLTLLPPADPDAPLKISYLLDYGPGSPIVPQVRSFELTPETFLNELAPCRTFLLEAEGHELVKSGVGRHLTPADMLVFGPHGVIANKKRFADEPARHKILDVVGDLALCGFDLAGHVVAFRSGHPLNVELARALTRSARRCLPAFGPARRAA